MLLAPLVALAAVVSFAPAPAQAAGTLVTYPNMPGHTVSSTFTMKVNGSPVLVESLNGVHYAKFAFGGTADIAITAPAAITSRRISPTAFGIASTVTGSTLNFSIAQDRRLIVKINGYADLLILADPLETGAPTLASPTVKNVMDFSPDASGASISTTQVQQAIDWVSANHATKNILYFPNGSYKVGTLTLKDHVHIYLAPGAVLRGTANIAHYPVMNLNYYNARAFLIAQNVQDVKVYGRGVIDIAGRQLIANHGFNSNSRLMGIVFTGVTGGSISDVLLRDTAFWHSYIHASTSVSVSNVKMISPAVTATQWNTDGVNIGSSSNVSVDRALIYNNDDASSIGSDLINGAASDTHDITFSNSVIRTGQTGFGLRLSPVVAPGRTLYNFKYSNNYIVRGAAGAIGANTAAGYETPGTVRNIVFDTIYTEDSGLRNFDLALLQSGSGPRRDIVFSNMYFDGFGSNDSRVAGYDSASQVTNIYFKNISIGGTVRNSLADARIVTNGNTANVRFLGSSNAYLAASGVQPITNLQTFSLGTADYDWVLPNVDQRAAATRISVSGGTAFYQDAATYPRFSYSNGSTFAGAQTRQASYRYNAPTATIAVPAGSGSISLWVGTGTSPTATISVSLPGAAPISQTFSGRQRFTFVYASTVPATIQATLGQGSNANVGLFGVAH